MKILVACEESQAVTIELRKLGHEAYSCDIESCSGGHSEWHIKDDVLPLLNGFCEFMCEDGLSRYIRGRWDMIIAFPPCTHLCVSGARHFAKKIEDGRQQQGIDFFMEFANVDCEMVAIENPIGVMSTKWRKPNQIIQPWQFGDKFTKSTCLWIKGMPNLVSTNIKKGVEKKQPKWYYDALKTAKSPAERAKLRSKTFPGIAKAMAEQWAGDING